MKRVFLLLWVFSVQVQAQNILRGQILDATTQEPIPGAVIHLHELKKGGVSNNEGYYVINNLPKGTFVVESKLIGYASRVESILIDGSTELNFLLSSVATELQEVVIIGTGYASELKNNPTPVSTIDLQALTANTSTNIIDNISKQPGLSQISSGAAISKPVIRGLGFNRIITLYDGIRQEGQQWGEEHGIEIDEFSVDRVEVIKGPGSLLYGSDGLGGVINFLPAEPVAAGSVIGKISSNYQINNGLFGNSLLNAGNLNGYYWSARVSNKYAKAYENAYDGNVFNSGFSETNWDLLAGKSGRWGYSQFAISNFDQNVGLTEGERDSNGNFTREIDNAGNIESKTVTQDDLSTYSLFIPKQNIKHFRVYNSSNLFFNESRFQLNVGYQHNQRKEFGNVVDENEAELFFDLTTINYNLIYFFPEKSGWSVSVGTGGMDQNNKNKGEEFLIPEYSLMDWGGFTFIRKHFKHLTFAGGFRYDIRNISIDALYLDDNGIPTDDINAFPKFDEAELSFSNYSASAGVTYEFSPLVHLKFNLARGFRAPNLSELASNGQHEGSLRYEYGNYNLAAETSLQGDFSATFDGDHISGEISLFKNNINNYIYSEKLLSTGGGDSIPDPDNPSPAYQYIQGNSSLYGAEFSIDIHPHPLDWLHFEHSFSFVRGENTSTGISTESKYLPMMPAPRYSGEIRGVFNNPEKSMNNLFAKLEFEYTWAQNYVLLENGTETSTASYRLWNFGLGGQVNSSRSELFKFYVTVNNMFDKAYQNHLSRLKYAAENPVTGRVGVFNMGRNISVKLVIPFTIRKPKN